MIALGNVEKNMKITRYLDEHLVVFLRENSREKVIHRLVDLLSDEGKLSNKQQFLSAILERENIVSTGIGIEVAIPHAKLPGQDTFFIAVGILQGEGVDWQAIDGSLVRIVFMIGGPDNAQSEYLKILSSLTQAIRDEKKRLKLLQSRTAKEVVDIFMESEYGS